MEPPTIPSNGATDLSQFRDTDAKRSVRSQAMIYHRSRSMINSAIDKLTAGKAHPRRHGKGSMKKGPTGTEQVRSTERQDKDRPSVALEPGLGTISPALTCVTSDDEGRGWSTAVTLRQNPRDQQYVKLAQETAWSTPESEDRISNLAPDVTVDYDDSYDQQVARNARARKTIPRATGRVVDYEYTDTQEERQTRRLIDKLVTIPCFGNAFDAFGLLPRYKNPAVDSLLLMRMFMRTFATDGLLAKWFQGGPNRDILLSAYLITSAWVDMRTGCPEESTRTTIAKMETLSIASERLSQPGTQLDNTTLIVLMHLLAGEAWGCNEKTLRTHQYGIAHLISQRGGLSSLGTPGFAELCASVWEPPKYNAVDHGRPIPESPIFCPWLDFVTIPHDSGCSAVTCALLQDMRDLTNLFLSHNKMSGASRATSSVDADYKAKAAGIRKRLISLPSAHIPGLTTSNDWIYEACRLAALIYAASIMLRLPFSVTADPRCNPLAIETEFFSSPDAGRHLRTTRLSDALYDVLNRTDLNNVWGNMSGVLYWVCTVGAVAARSPTTLDMKRRQSPTATEAKAMWIRRCLTLTSLRIVVVLVFDHAIPIVRAQKTLLKVQELIGTYDGATSTVIELHAHEEMKRTPPMP
ncbi:hypothetical protein CFE70_007557 [Pyrenophora teres f. teres 0-1]